MATKIIMVMIINEIDFFNASHPVVFFVAEDRNSGSHIILNFRSQVC